MNRRSTGRLAAGLLLVSAAGSGAQEAPLTDPEAFGRWESLRETALSPDGRWLAHTVERVDGTGELRVWGQPLDSTATFPWGSAPRFAASSRWLAWTAGVSSEAAERLEEAGEPVRTGVTVMSLEDPQELIRLAEVSSFSFGPTGRFLAVRGYPPGEPAGKGGDLRVLDLEQGTETSFGNVTSVSWSDSLPLLAMVIGTGTDEGNGVQVFDAASGRVSALDASGSSYEGLAWRESGPDLAVLRSDSVASKDGSGYSVLAWRNVLAGARAANVLRSNPAGIADTLEVVRHHTPAWSPDGRSISVGLRPVAREEADGDESPAADEADPGDGPDSDEAEAGEVELPGVQIWHTKDVALFPEQQVGRSRSDGSTLTAIWHLDEDRVVQIGSTLDGRVRILHGWERAIEETDDAYPWGAMFGRPYRDVHLVDTDDGGRTTVLERVRYAWPSAGGQWLVAFDGEDYTSVNVTSGDRFNLTEQLPATFADTAYDTPTDLLPPFGFGPGGWEEEDGAVFLYDEHDVWRVAPDGSETRRLTDGVETGITHRLSGPEDDNGVPGRDPQVPIYLSLHDDQSEERGYSRLMPDGALERLVLGDAFFTGLTKADSAEVYAYRAMAHDDPPDVYLAGPDLSDPVQATEINPFIDEYAWSRAELVDFVSESGRPLQAAIHYPPGFRPGSPVPMIVYTYEILAPQIHVFENPSERDYYNFTTWTQHGYAVLLPDIVYRARDPGISALESVRAAVAEVVEMGVADPDRVGLIGHSWGGYQATFLPTRTDIFAASVAGAPLTDFVSMMGALHWNPGIAELSHWETGQARMEVPFWEDPEAHRRNSPIHRVQDMETPLLMAFGDEDGVVDWDQGTEFFNFARRAGKQMVLLVYEGEDHGFRQEANQRDYHRRILEWFGHYLKGEPAPAWITDGVKLPDLEDEKRRVAEKKTGKE